MDKRTLTALRGSIEKWRLIAEGVGEDRGAANCPLCEEFYSDACVDCPVLQDTGRGCCQNTPFVDWSKSFGFDSERIAKREKEKLLAINEYVYLLSLLPEGVYE